METHVIGNAFCVNCSTAFEITHEETISKLSKGMRLPKRCKECRKTRRDKTNPHLGLYSIFFSYPATKGHRHQVHGGR